MVPMLVAKTIAPLVTHGTTRYPVLEQAADASTTLFTVPAGYIPAESLMAALAERGKKTIWLRLGPEDSDPGTFLLSLILAVQHICPGAGTSILEEMRQKPGPLFGWSPFFTHFGSELAETLPPSSAIVLDNIHYLNDIQPALNIFGTHFLPALPPSITSILISQQRLPPAALPSNLIHRESQRSCVSIHAGVYTLPKKLAQICRRIPYAARLLSLRAELLP